MGMVLWNVGFCHGNRFPIVNSIPFWSDLWDGDQRSGYGSWRISAKNLPGQYRKFIFSILLPSGCELASALQTGRWREYVAPDLKDSRRSIFLQRRELYEHFWVLDSLRSRFQKSAVAEPGVGHGSAIHC